MKSIKEKQLEIQLLTEKIERISNKKIVLEDRKNPNFFKAHPSQKAKVPIRQKKEYEKIKKEIDEIRSCIPDLINVYDGKILGSELYKIILEITPLLAEKDDYEYYKDFIDQINKPEKFSEMGTFSKKTQWVF